MGAKGRSVRQGKGAGTNLGARGAEGDARARRVALHIEQQRAPREWWPDGRDPAVPGRKRRCPGDRNCHRSDPSRLAPEVPVARIHRCMPGRHNGHGAVGRTWPVALVAGDGVGRPCRPEHPGQGLGQETPRPPLPQHRPRPSLRRNWLGPGGPDSRPPVADDLEVRPLSLTDEDRHGYAIILEVARRTQGELKLSAGTLYRSIQRMLETGLIVETRKPACT